MDILARIESLEIKMAFQDDLVETLNSIVVKQQQQIELLQQQVKVLYQQIKSLQPSNIADAADDVPPPHY